MSQHVTPVRFSHAQKNGPITIWTEDPRDDVTPDEIERASFAGVVGETGIPTPPQDPPAQDPPRPDQQVAGDMTESQKLEYQPDVERALTPAQEKMAAVRAGKKTTKPRVASAITPADEEIF